MKWYANYLEVGNCVQVNFLFFSRALNHFPYSKASWTLLCWNPAWGLTSTIKLPSPGKSFDLNQLFLGNVLDTYMKYHHLKDIWYVLAQLQNTSITTPVHTYIHISWTSISIFLQKHEIYFYAFFKRTLFFLYTFPFVW